MRLDKGRHCEIDRSRFRKLRTKHLLESRGREGTREGFGPKCNFDILECGGQFLVEIAVQLSRPDKSGLARISGHLGKIARITPGFL